MDNQAPQSIPTPGGDARVTTTRAARPVLTLALGHGAGGGIDAVDLAVLAAALPKRGVTVIRVEQPWRVAGRKVAGPPANLDRDWLAVLATLRVRGPLVVGGRSAGARVACRTATAVGAVGCLALAFPLHPPGRPDKTRLPELAGAGVPTLVVQGENDVFGGPAAFPAGDYRLHAVAGADHSFRVRRSLDQEATVQGIAETVAAWLDELAGPAGIGRAPGRLR